MRIAIWHDLPSGGGKRALHDQVRGLVARGHSVEIWCPDTADRSYLPLSPLAPEHVLPLGWRDVSTRSGLRDRVRWVLRDRHRNLAMLERHCRACADEINRGGFDVLLAHACRFVAVAPIARFVEAPRVLYLQEPNRALYEAMPTWPWLVPELDVRAWARPRAVVAWAAERVRVAYYRALAREEARNVRAYERVLVNSLYSREAVLRAYGVNARTCYLGVEAGHFVDRSTPREDFVVGVGSLTPAKNIEFVVRAVARVRAPRPRLVWIGNATATGHPERLRALAASLGVELELRTLVSEEELVDALNRAAMMVYAPRLEPFGYVPLEANACGLPVVAVAEGGVRETVVDGLNGVLVQEDEDEMARAIERLRGDPALRRSLGQAGRRLVAERWTPEAAAGRLERALEEIAGRRR
jgi:glycosyltransferase involved in cell wall biosynthesis